MIRTLQAGKSVALLMEYRLACYLGRAWDRLGGRRGRARGRGAAVCEAVARGDSSLPAGDLGAAQEFAARMWLVAGFACVIAILAVAMVAEALPRGGWRDALADSLFGFGLVVAVSLAQMGMISYRRNQTTRYFLRLGPEAAAKPSGACRGLPRRSDFWLMLVIALAGSMLIFCADMHSPV
jgi:hypothetical protein